MFPGFLVCLDLLQDIVWHVELFFGEIAKRFTYFFDDFALFEQFPQPLLIGGGVCAFRLARREALGAAVLIQRFDNAVDPAEAERLFDGIVIFDARLAGRFFVIDQPDFFLGLLVFAQPLAPIFAVCDV